MSSPLSELRWRIALELCITPLTVIPGGIGASLLLLSPILGIAAGLLGVLGLVGAGCGFLTTLLFNGEKIAQRALDQWQKQQSHTRERDLDALEAKLRETPDSSDEEALMSLRAVYKTFCDDYTQGLISRAPGEMITLIHDIFKACIGKLTLSYECYKNIQRIKIIAVRKKCTDQRKKLIKEVEGSVVELASIIDEVRALQTQSDHGDLQQLQQKLSNQLAIAKATEENLASLNSMGIDERLAEYQ
jgi:hypothetical protein